LFNLYRTIFDQFVIFVVTVQEKRMKLRIIALFLAALAVVGGAGYFGYQSSRAEATPPPAAPTTVPVEVCDVEQTVTAPGHLVNTREQPVEMPVEGRLAEVLVRPGDRVTEGQVLARLADREKYAAEVAAQQLALLQAQHDLEQLSDDAPLKSAEAQVALVEAQQALEEATKARARLEQPRADSTTIETARTHYAVTEEAFKAARKAYQKVAGKKENDPERIRALQEMVEARNARDKALATLNWYEGHASEGEIAEAEANLTLAQTQLERAQENWDSLQAGPDPLEVDLAEAKVKDARARLAEAEADLASIEIKAPYDGAVLEVNARAGERLAAGTALLVLSDPQALEVEATVIEEDLPYVETGQPVDLFFDALPDEQVQGTISRIVPQRLAGDRPLYTVYINLERVPEKLVAGMTSDASVIIAQRQAVLCLPRALVGASPNGKAIVEVWANGREEQRPVEVGLRGDTTVEILSGLEEGEQVVAR
jgi:RND family efflux transporter MFP subunit